MIFEEFFTDDIVECHIDAEDPETFIVCKILAKDDKWILVQIITPFAHYNGFALILQSDIVKIKRKTAYCERIKKALTETSISFHVDIKISNHGLLSNLLQYSIEKHKLIAIELCKSGYRDVIGEVISFRDNVLFIEQYNDEGNTDGESYIKIDSITRIFYSDVELEFIEKIRP